jgi:hypothetical protein
MQVKLLRAILPRVQACIDDKMNDMRAFWLPTSCNLSNCKPSKLLLYVIVAKAAAALARNHIHHNLKGIYKPRFRLAQESLIATA